MKLANKIQRKLLNWCNGSNDIVLPNYYYGLYEMDVFRLTGSSIVVEYEIKISRSDYFADFNKSFGSSKKHNGIANGEKANRFYFVVPENLITINEVPEYCGLIYYKEYGFDLKKNAPMIHRNKFKDYEELARKLGFRETNLRYKIWRYQDALKTPIEV